MCQTLCWCKSGLISNNLLVITEAGNLQPSRRGRDVARLQGLLATRKPSVDVAAILDVAALPREPFKVNEVNFTNASHLRTHTRTDLFEKQIGTKSNVCNVL